MNIVSSTTDPQLHLHTGALKTTAECSAHSLTLSLKATGHTRFTQKAHVHVHRACASCMCMCIVHA